MSSEERSNKTSGERQPNLGLATTAELLNELRCRIEIDYFNGGGGLGYSTVGGRPESVAVSRG